MNPSVMCPAGAQSISYEFSDKIPPRFGWHDNYGPYHDKVKFWMNLTTLITLKYKPAVVDRLHCEEKSVAKKLYTEKLNKEGGVELILERLDKAYVVDKANKLDANFADLLRYSQRKGLSVEHFTFGFHTTVDKISSLNPDDHYKGHLLLCQANLEYQDRNVVVGAESGSYDVSCVSAALHNIYRNGAHSISKHHGYNCDQQNRKEPSKWSSWKKARRKQACWKVTEQWTEDE